MMRLCPTHWRGLIPEGYDRRRRIPVPAHWHPVAPITVVVALAYAQAFACTGEVQLMIVTCDQCQQEETAA